MDPTDLAIINEHLPMLVNNMDTAPVVDYLLSWAVLHDHHHDEIRVKQTRADKNRELLIILKTRGQSAFEKLVDALNKTEQQHLAKLLRDKKTSQDGGNKNELATQAQREEDNNTTSTSVVEVQKLLQDCYLHRFEKVNPFSLPFTFDIEETWISLSLRRDMRNLRYNSAFDSNITDDHSHLLKTVMEKVKMLIIEGKAATGKTSLMRRFAFEWSKGNVNFNHYSLVLYSEFRNLQNKKFLTMLEMVLDDLSQCLDENEAQKVKNCLENKRFFENNRVLILLDGYDESLPNGQCKELRDYLELPEARKRLLFDVVLSTRPGYVSNLRGQEGRFVFADVLGFTTEKQLSAYISAHFSRSEKSEEKTQAVKNLITKHNNLRKIAETPLFLVFICIVYEQLLDQPTIVQLYSRIIWWLLDRYQKTHVDENLPGLFGFDKHTEMQKWKVIQDYYLEFPVLQNLASMALLKEEQTTFSQTDLDQFNLNNIIESIGLLQKEEERQSGQLITKFVFPHRTIQEFFAALRLLLPKESYSANYTDLLQKFEKYCVVEKRKMQQTDLFVWHILLSSFNFRKETQTQILQQYSSLTLNLLDISVTRQEEFDNFNKLLSKCDNVSRLVLFLTGSVKQCLTKPIDISQMKLIKYFSLTSGDNYMPDGAPVEFLAENVSNFEPLTVVIIPAQREMEIVFENIFFLDEKLFKETIIYLSKSSHSNSVLCCKGVRIPQTKNEDKYERLVITTEAMPLSTYIISDEIKSDDTYSKRFDAEFEVLKYAACVSQLTLTNIMGATREEGEYKKYIYLPVTFPFAPNLKSLTIKGYYFSDPDSIQFAFRTSPKWEELHFIECRFKFQAWVFILTEIGKNQSCMMRFVMSNPLFANNEPLEKFFCVLKDCKYIDEFEYIIGLTYNMTYRNFWNFETDLTEILSDLVRGMPQLKKLLIKGFKVSVDKKILLDACKERNDLTVSV